MSNKSAGWSWTLGDDDAQAVLANARKALFVMVGVLAVIWIVQIVNWADHYHLTFEYGVTSWSVTGLPHILTAPFLHFSWTHIEGNSGPLFVFGFLAAYRGLGRFAGVTALVVLTSGFAAWFFEPPGVVGAGASGVVFGYFGYIMVRGLFDRNAIDLIIGAVMALSFAYQFSVLLPHQGIGWQAHIGGLVGGIAAGWIFRDHKAASARRAQRQLASKAPAAGTAVGGTTSSGAITSGKPAGKAGAPPAPSKSGDGKKLAVDPSNPRADLYKELDDLGL